MIKKAIPTDCKTLATLAIKMWDSHTIQELTENFADTINSKNAVYFLKYSDNKPVGFAQCSLRHDYVEGTNSSPVGYLEGIFVEEAYRTKGYAIELLKTCEEWAKGMGCTEFASDCELQNAQSLSFHLAAGFKETNRIICFKKSI